MYGTPCHGCSAHIVHSRIQLLPTSTVEAPWRKHATTKQFDVDLFMEMKCNENQGFGMWVTDAEAQTTHIVRHEIPKYWEHINHNERYKRGYRNFPRLVTLRRREGLVRFDPLMLSTGTTKCISFLAVVIDNRTSCGQHALSVVGQVYAGSCQHNNNV